MRFLLCISLTISLASCNAQDEPMAGGKPLSFWKKEARKVSLFSFWNSDNDYRRHEAFRRMSEIGPPAVPTLVNFLKENRMPVSGDAFNALANLGPRAEPAIPELRKLLKGDQTSLQRDAAWILGKIGPAAKPAVPDLVWAMHQPDVRLREISAEALAQIGGEGTAALNDAFASSDPRTREVGMAGMIARSFGADSLKPLLARGLADSDPMVRVRAIALMIRARRDDAAEIARYLVMALDDTDPRVKKAAHEMLTMYFQGERATPAFLAVILTARDNEARADAAWRLAETTSSVESPADSLVEQSLARALDDSDPKVRIYSARALMSSGSRMSRRAIEVLRRDMPAVEPILRVRAARTMWIFRRDPGDVTAAYKAGLGDPEKWNRVETISAIGGMGADAKIFVSDLERLQKNDPDPEVRDRAWKILYFIRRVSG